MPIPEILIGRVPDRTFVHKTMSLVADIGHVRPGDPEIEINEYVIEIATQNHIDPFKSMSPTHRLFWQIVAEPETVFSCDVKATVENVIGQSSNGPPVFDTPRPAPYALALKWARRRCEGAVNRRYAAGWDADAGPKTNDVVPGADRPPPVGTE